MTATLAIHLDDVSWTYAGAEAPALAALDLTIGQGETVVLAGASGSGKSTALRLMNGLIPRLHDGELTGDTRLFGVSSAAVDLGELGRSTGSVWQHPFRQFFTSAVADEIAFAMENHADPPEHMRHRVDELLADHGLSHLRNRRLSTLSSGQQQLVALLATVAHRPRLLLLDEPAANLSDNAASQLVTSLARLRGEGTTIVIAEHRVHPFISFTDRLVYFREGRIDTTWTSEEFLRLSDHELVTHGLRSRTVPAHQARPAAASGRSIAVTIPTRQKRISDPPTHQLEGDGVILEHIRCVKDSHVVLDIEHARFPAGRVTALRGMNGAGKTTLARIIVGLQRHTGRVRVDGAAASRRLRRRSSMIITQEAP